MRSLIFLLLAALAAGIAELRRFYRMSRERKFQHIERMA